VTAAGEVIVGLGHASEHRDAVALGVELARALDAKLLLAGVYSAPLGAGASAYERLLREELEGDLERAALEVPPDVAVGQIAVGAASPIGGLHELADQRHAAVLVLGPSHLDPLRRRMRGDIAVAILHASPCAVAVAPTGYASRRTVDRPPIIGVAYVPSVEGDAALEAAVDVATRRGGRLRLLHVTVASALIAHGADMDAAREATRLALALGRDAVDGRVPCEVVALDGDAGDCLAAAGDDLDLLVLGTRGPRRGRSAVARQRLGARGPRGALPVADRGAGCEGVSPGWLTRRRSRPRRCT
jgi:nucleotide-binding universal stress UspA family protein